MSEILNQPPTIPPVPPADNPPVVPPVVENLPQPNATDAALAEMRLMIQQQQQEIARLSNPQPVTQQVQQEEVSFYSDPQKAIKQQVDASIAPINSFIQSFQRSQIYQSNKIQLRNAFPNLAQYWNVIEPQLDGIFLNGQVDPSPTNLMTAVNNIVGQMTIRNPGSFTTPVQQNNQLPPNIPSSPPIVPPVQNAPSNIKLTEQQKYMAKYNGLTEEEFALRLVTPTIITV